MPFFVTTRYPIGQVIIKRIQDAEVRLPDFIRGIGYKNVNKGMRAFYLLVKEGRGPTIFITRLQTSQFAIDQTDLAAALSATEKILQMEAQKKAAEELDKERAAFQPFFLPQSKVRPPMPITIFALLGGYEGLRHFLPPDISAWSQEEKLKYMSEAIIKDYNQRVRYAKQMVGSLDCASGTTDKNFDIPIKYHIPLAQDIESYLVFENFDAPPYAFTIAGEFIGLAPESSLPKVYVTTKRRIFPK